MMLLLFFYAVRCCAWRGRWHLRYRHAYPASRPNDDVTPAHRESPRINTCLHSTQCATLSTPLANQSSTPSTGTTIRLQVQGVPRMSTAHFQTLPTFGVWVATFHQAGRPSCGCLTPGLCRRQQQAQLSFGSRRKCEVVTDSVAHTTFICVCRPWQLERL